MIKTKFFNFDFLNENGDSLFKEIGGLFKTMTIVEKVNNISYFEIEFNSEDITIFEKIHNIIFQYESESTTYQSTLGINRIVYDKTSIVLSGYMTAWENFKLANTRYLADNLKDALLATGVKNKITLNNNNQFTNQLSGNLFQINTTNLQQCLDLCAVAADSPYWSICRDSINVCQGKELDTIEIPSLYSSEIYPSGQNNDSVETLSSPFELLNGSQYRNSYTILDNLYENHFNFYLKNKKMESLGSPVYISFSGDTEYPYPVGTIGKNTTAQFTNIKKWVVLSITYVLTSSAISSKVLLGGIE